MQLKKVVFTAVVVAVTSGVSIGAADHVVKEDQYRGKQYHAPHITAEQHFYEDVTKTISKVGGECVDLLKKWGSDHWKKHKEGHRPWTHETGDKKLAHHADHAVRDLLCTGYDACMGYCRRNHIMNPVTMYNAFVNDAI